MRGATSRELEKGTKHPALAVFSYALHQSDYLQALWRVYTRYTAGGNNKRCAVSFRVLDTLFCRVARAGLLSDFPDVGAR
jgi:hypothetical protein